VTVWVTVWVGKETLQAEIGRDQWSAMPLKSATEYVVLGALMTGARHGYEIMQFLGSSLEATWRVSTSQLYVLLKRLKEEGCLESFSESHGTRPPKRVFNLTAQGRKVFLEWLSEPIEHVRDFRMEFLCKMYFFDHLSLPGAPNLVEAQIRFLDKLLEKIRKGSAKDNDGFKKLVYSFKQRNAESLLSWLVEEARPFAGHKRRFKALSS
jgi:PadR family transcriptional regulator, regulatory protein AphA